MASHRERWVSTTSLVREERRDRRNFLGVILSALLFPVLLAAGAGECGRSIVDVDQSQREARGEHLLRDMFDAVSAYPYDRIAELADPQLLSDRRSDPDFSLELGVTEMRRDVLRIEATLVDSATLRQVGRFVTYRTRT